LVDRPRIVALVAEPPEITLRSVLTLGLLVAGAREVEVTWRACSPLDSFNSNGQYGENAGDQTCRDSPSSLWFGGGERITVEAQELQRFVSDDAELRMRLGTSLPGFELDMIRQTVGVTFTVEAEVVADGKRLWAQKRVLLREGGAAHTNPPVPDFTFADRPVRGDETDSMSFACRAATTAAEQALPGERVQLAPTLDKLDKTKDEEPWLESYMVLDASGSMVERQERAFYSWFATAGTFEKGTTRSPTRDNAWTAPTTPGCTTLWLVVRDGHGGESACGLPVSVGTTEACTLGQLDP
jgi:hypothetical protein